VPHPDQITVLLLEDDPDVLEATTLVLEDEGFRVLSAATLESAQQLARQVGRCVILLDLSLEGDSLQFIRSLHESSEWDGQVLVFSAGDRLEERAAAIGADGALQKPFEIDALVSELRDRYAAVETAHAG
jgi:DNA-binding response OmpR family regulator